MADDPAATFQLMRLLDGYLTTQLLYVAAELGIADELADGPRTAAELAAAVDVQPAALARVLRGLVIEDVLAEDDEGRFALKPIGEALRALQGAAVVRGAVYYSAAGAMLDAVRHGGTPFERVNGAPFFDHLDRHPAEQEAFELSMAGRAEQEARAAAGACGELDLGTIVDVGGGRGVLLGALLADAPDRRGVLFDRPPVVAAAADHLERAGLRERVELVEGDFFAGLPASGDTYLLSRVLHDWDDRRAAQILRRCGEAMAPTSRLLIVEAVLPTRAADLPAAIRMDLHMLVLLGARERTAAEFADLLAGAGFALVQVIPTGSPTGLAVIEARLRTG